MKIERFRKFNTKDVYPGQTLDNDMSMVAKAGNRIFMRGQTGLGEGKMAFSMIRA